MKKNKISSDGKLPLLLFSGGNDSTLMLMNALQKSDVYTLYVDCCQHEEKVQMELKARSEIFKILLKQGEHLVLTDHGIKELRELNGTYGSFMEFRQTLPWIIGAVYIADPYRVSEVQIGYILGDDITIKLDTIKKLWKQIWKLVNGNKPVIPLRFPLIEKGFRKTDVLRALPKNLLLKTWVCELPVKDNNITKPCGACPACLILYNAKAQIKRPLKNLKQLLLVEDKETTCS